MGDITHVQNETAREPGHPESGSHTWRVYADGVLLAVAKVMGRRFRQ
jgi:hypothetical protein